MCMCLYVRLCMSVQGTHRHLKKHEITLPVKLDNNLWKECAEDDIKNKNEQKTNEIYRNNNENGNSI